MTKSILDDSLHLKMHNIKALNYLNLQDDYKKNSLHLLLPESYLNIPLIDMNAIESSFAVYFLSLSVFEDAINCFLQQKYRNFDALVGNNSCYLVAYIIFILATRMQKDESYQDNCIKLLKEIRHLKKAIARLAHRTKEIGIQNSKKKLSEFLIENNFIINCDVDFIYLCLSFGCAIIKEKKSDEIEEINYEILFEKYRYLINFELKKKAVIKLIKHWQKNISFINIQTIQDHSKFIQFIDKDWVKYIHDQYILKDERGRLCTSSLYAQRVIYNLLLTIPKAIIGLQVNVIDENKKYLNRFTLYYEVNSYKKLNQVAKEKVTANEPIYMFVGCRYLLSDACKRNIEEIESEFTGRNLKDLIFAHEVTYPQYPKSLKAKNIEPTEQEITNEILRLMEYEGFSLEDPRDICIAHIFTDDSSTQLCSFNEPPLYLPASSSGINF